MEFGKRYRTIFAIDEIEGTPVLQGLFWVLFAGFFISFGLWIDSGVATKNAVEAGVHVCPPYFQSCDSLLFLKTSPDSYAYETLYVILSGFLVLSGIAAYRKRWSLAHFFLLPPFLWKVIYVGFLTYRVTVEYEYFHIPIVALFLLAHRKLYFARRAWITLYFLSATVKFNESWILGTYFSSLDLGMPLVPDFAIPLVSIGVILFETLSPWFLISQNQSHRKAALTLWVAFHLYSIHFVKFRYPLYCFPTLLVLFLPLLNKNEGNHGIQPPHLGARFATRFAAQLTGWSLIAFLIVLQLLPEILAENRLYSLRGRKLGVAMFIANYQCQSTTKKRKADGSDEESKIAQADLDTRCDPYSYFFTAKQQCRGNEGRPVEWQLLSSVNGGPFYLVAHASNVCALEYNFFGRNEWLKFPETGAPVAGYPKKKTLITTTPWVRRQRIVFDEPQFEMSPFQKALSPYVPELTIAFWLLWFVTAAYFLFFHGRRPSQSSTARLRS